MTVTDEDDMIVIQRCYSALEWAARGGNTEIVSLLLSAGADEAEVK